MTETRMFAIFDTKSKLFGELFKSPNSDTAQREFSIAVNGSGMMAKFPEDYVLFEMGDYTYKTGIYVQFDPINSICNGLALVDQAPANPTGSPYNQAAISLAHVQKG